MIKNPHIARILLSVLGLMAALCPLVGAASPATAVLRASANVRVNGTPVTHSTLLFAGDLVRTENSAVSLEMSGSGILLDKESTAILENDQLSLICGGTVIKTVKGLGVRVSKLEIRPTNDTARFEIVRQQQSIRITALDGDLKVSEGSRKMVVKAGHQLDLACSQCLQQTANAQGTISSDEVNTANNNFCDLPADVVAQPVDSLPIAAVADSAIGSAMLVWILGESTPVSPDHL